MGNEIEKKNSIKENEKEDEKIINFTEKIRIIKKEIDPLKNLSNSEFQQKIELIKITYDFINLNKDEYLKEDRKNSINIIFDIISNEKYYSKFVIPNLSLIIGMIEENIFNNINSQNRNEKEIQEYLDNINSIYDILYILINNKECKAEILKEYIKYDFLNKFVNLFESNIYNERKTLKIILHQLYSKLISKRRLIRGIISNYLYYNVISLKKINGAAELLDVMTSIILGYTIPLKDEHINFFKNTIIPLYQMEKCNFFFDNLNRCTMLFLEKDSSLSIILLEKILEFFSFQPYKIKILFLNEIENILDFCDIDKINPLVEKLFKIIVGCFSEYNITIKEKALSLFENEIFVCIIKKYNNISFNTIVPKINYFRHNPWNNKSKQILKNINSSFKNRDYKRYRNVLKYNSYNEIKISPGNTKEENNQINLAIKLSEINKKETKKDKIEDKTENKNELYINKFDEYKNNKDEKINLRKSEILEELNKLKINTIEEEVFDEEFGICPITQEYMKHPVLCPSGNYYEKSAILNWLKKNKTEPLTRQYSTADMLIEDEEFKKKIIEYRKKFHK